MTHEYKTISHHTAMEIVIKKHDLEKPFAPENGKRLKFKIGDKVIYTNEYGATFRCTVTGYYEPPSTTSSYAYGGRYHLDSDCYWMTYKEAELKLASQEIN